MTFNHKSFMMKVIDFIYHTQCLFYLLMSWLQACDMPLYLKAPLFFCAVAQGCQVPVDAAKDALGGGKASPSAATNGPTSSSTEVAVGKKEFIDFWRRLGSGQLSNLFNSIIKLNNNLFLNRSINYSNLLKFIFYYCNYKKFIVVAFNEI